MGLGQGNLAAFPQGTQESCRPPYFFSLFSKIKLIYYVVLVSGELQSDLYIYIYIHTYIYTSYINHNSSYESPAPRSRGFLRQEAWSGLLFPSPEDLPDPGIEP